MKIRETEGSNEKNIKILKQLFGKWIENGRVRKNNKNGNRKGADMTVTRAKELVNAMIDHILVSEKNNDVIGELLSIGFTENELVIEFGFCESDVADVLEKLEAL